MRIKFNSLLYKTNRFHVAMGLFSNRSQKTSKCGKNISDTLGYRLVCHFFVLTTFWRHCDLLLNRRTATWNLFVKWNLIIWMKMFLRGTVGSHWCLHDLNKDSEDDFHSKHQSRPTVLLRTTFSKMIKFHQNLLYTQTLRPLIVSLNIVKCSKFVHE